MSSSSFHAELDKMRSSGVADQQGFAALVDNYLGPASQTALPKQTSHYWVFLTVAGQAAQLFTSDEVAARIAKIVLINVARGEIAHPVIECFMLRAFGHQDAPPHSALLELVQQLGITSKEIAPKFARYAHSLFFGWTPQKSSIHASVATWTAPETLQSSNPMENYILSLSDAELSDALTTRVIGPRGAYLRMPGRLIGSLAKFRPGALQRWADEFRDPNARWTWEWEHVLAATDRWDRTFEKASSAMPTDNRLRLLAYLADRGRTSPRLVRSVALDPNQIAPGAALVYLARHWEEDFIPEFLKLARDERLFNQSGLPEAFSEAARRWGAGGKEIFDLVAETDFEKTPQSSSRAHLFCHFFVHALEGLLSERSTAPESEISSWFGRALQAQQSEKIPGASRTENQRFLLEALAVYGKGRLLEELFNGLGDSSKGIRSCALKGLLHHPAADLIPRALELLASKKTDIRLGAAELLAALNDPTTTAAVIEALKNESSDKVKAPLQELLSAQGVKASAQPLHELEAAYAAVRKKQKVPGSAWLKLESLPTITTVDSAVLSENAIVFLLSRQATAKTIAASPEIEPLLEHLNPQGSAAFAAAVVNGFLDSEQAASDRWALALGGLLGDSRVIPPLLSRIPGWCENARHKLAEYAAQAISLLPGNEPLMVLDTLANRYRSKFKNVGKACSDAFMAAAKARGIITVELGDMVVPSFEFDSDGVRRFDWESGGASAELGPDFKLSWFDPETDKSWKTLPASAPESVKTEVKTLTKMLREAVKAQTPRLEMAMVCQRRWTPERWRELYENHPLLRSFASRLVWGIYDTSGNMIRSFRRYPNGILANAEGGMEELTESDVTIGIAHPLEMDATALTAWRTHLARFKVTPPFPQINRTVETPDPLHGNRREIALTKEKNISAGSLRSRGEKRGWVRGSVIDGGAISSYYKPYPGAGVEVILPTDGLWAGCEPTEGIELGAAYFVKGGTVGRGSYVYDEPGPDDPNVLRFDAVPAVVWSEAIADLKAILGS